MKTKPQNNSNRLSLIEHFEELRKRLLYSVLILIITSSIAFIFNKQIIAILLNTLESEIVLRNGDIVFVEIMEMFSTSMKVSLLFGFIVAFPFILHQFFLFIIPGLNTKEKKIVSLGHRNPQGLYYDKVNDLIISTDHGPKGGDEINIIIGGGNYGWPLVSHGFEYGTNDTNL